jgi:acetolactate synthase I/II/III large subunit
MKIKASDYIAAFLREQQTTHVFEMAGGMITHILDSLYCLGNTTIVSVHHEQAAAFAADAYGRCTGRPGVALATSGPGATNLLTGIASCYFDSSPALFITGQVNTYEQKGSRQIRQLGFQETDIVSMATPITKKCFQVDDAEHLEEILNEAYSLTMEGRPGPVLVDIPMNIQRAEIEIGKINFIGRKKISSAASDIDNKLDLLYQALQQAQRPLILAGNGIGCARSVHLFRHFMELIKIPVVTSLLAIDSVPSDHPLKVGMIGSYGNRWANLAIGMADLLIVIGSRLDIRQTGADIAGFRQKKTIFHIDCDVSEINNRVQDCIPIIIDIGDFLANSCAFFSTKNLSASTQWLNEINLLKEKWSDTQELKLCRGINPNVFMHQLSKNAHHAVAFIVDVGNHQMWAAQSLELKSHQLFITSGGMGAMGFALPAAIGSCLALGCRPTLAIAGDGAFQLNIQELQTIVRNKLPIKIIIINNQALGMIRQFQDSYFSGRYQSTYWGYSAPKFSAIAAAYGIPARTISKPEEVAEACEWFWNTSLEYGLLEVMVDSKINAYPKIAFGKPITEMEPFASPVEMEGT